MARQEEINKKVLGQLIAWLVMELGEHNAKALLNELHKLDEAPLSTTVDSKGE